MLAGIDFDSYMLWTLREENLSYRSGYEVSQALQHYAQSSELKRCVYLLVAAQATFQFAELTTVRVLSMMNH